MVATRGNPRTQMMAAMEHGHDEDGYKPKSVQMAPGKRGERPPSYNSGRAQMQKKIESAHSLTPKQTWFVGGALLMLCLYFYHAMQSR